jgi:hypothetical protein
MQNLGFIVNPARQQWERFENFMMGLIPEKDLPVEIRILIKNIKNKQRVIATTLEERLWLKGYGRYKNYKTERVGPVLIGHYKQ